MKKALHILGIVLSAAAGLFLITLVVYFFNLDMKLSAAAQPLLNKWYDHFPRPPLP